MPPGMHGVQPTVIVEEGNPVQGIRAHAESADLLVIGHAPTSENRVLAPEIALHLIHETNCSLLLVPWNTSGR